MFVTKASSCSPSPPRAHREGSGSLSQPLAQLCLFTQAGAALMNSPHLPTSPCLSHHCYWWVCIYFSSAPTAPSLSEGSCSPHLPDLLPMGSPVPSPALQEALSHLAVQRHRAQGQRLVPWSSWLGAVPATGHPPPKLLHKRHSQPLILQPSAI